MSGQGSGAANFYRCCSPPLDERTMPNFGDLQLGRLSSANNNIGVPSFILSGAPPVTY